MIYLIFIISIIFHELGHILVAKILNVKICKVKFKIIGFSAEFEGNIEDFKVEKIIILLAGPLINFILAIITLYLKFDLIYKNEIVYTNILLCVFNILPIMPLDGGRILCYIFNLKFKFEKSFEIENKISKFFLVILSVSYSIIIYIVKNVEICFLIIYLWCLNIKEEEKFNWHMKINKNIRKYLNL